MHTLKYGYKTWSNLADLLLNVSYPGFYKCNYSHACDEVCMCAAVCAAQTADFTWRQAFYDLIFLLSFTVSQSPCSAIPCHHRGCIPHRRLWLYEAIVIHRPRCFHCLCIFLGIWITIPLWLRICWPNERTWLIDTGGHQHSRSSSPVVNKHWMFYLTNVCLIMDHFNPVGGAILQRLPIHAWRCRLTSPTS